MQIKERLIANTLFGFLELFFGRLFGFFVTPYVLYKLGLDNFAVWSIMGSILGYLAKADMGVATSYAKFISEYFAQKDYPNINKVLNSGFVYYAAIGGLIYTLTALWGDAIFDLFRIEAAMRGEVNRLFRYCVLISVCGSALDVFNAVLWGLQRADLVKKVQMGIYVVDGCCNVLFLALGFGLRGLVLTSALTTACSAAASIFLASRLLPELRFNPLLFDAAMFRRMFGYGIQLQLGRVAKMGQMHLSKLILAHFLPLATVAIYDLGNRLALAVRSLPLSLSPAIIPAASHLYAQHDLKTLYRLYERGTKYMTLLVMHLTGFFGCLLPVVILSWLGRQVNVAEVSAVGRIIMVGYAYFLLSDIASVVVLGMGHPEYGLRGALLKLIVNLGLNFWLIPAFGFIGAAWATALAEMVGTGYFVTACHREFHKSYLMVVREIYVLPFVASGAAAGLAWLLAAGIKHAVFIPQGRIGNFGILLAAGALFTATYALILLKSGYLDSYDKKLFREHYQRMARFL